MSASTQTKLPNERTVTITRVFDAPRELVFRMWTESEHMAQWWGPQCFTNPVCEIDVRPGGKILSTCAGPMAPCYPMTASSTRSSRLRCWCSRHRARTRGQAAARIA